MAEGYYELEGDDYYYEQIDGVGYYESVPNLSTLLGDRVNDHPAMLLRVFFDDLGVDSEYFSYFHPAPLIDNKMWLPFITQPITITSRTADSAGLLRESETRSFGTIVLTVPTELVTTLGNRRWEENFFEIYVGPANTQDVLQFPRVAAGYIQRAEVTENEISLTLSDGSHFLKNQITRDRFLGTGQQGAVEEGTAELEGQPKGVLFGIAENITPILVDPAFNLYQTDVGLTTITAVRDGGLPIQFAGTVDSLALSGIRDWVAVPGQWIYDPPTGKLRLGAPPTRQLTCDVERTPPFTIWNLLLGVLQKFEKTNEIVAAVNPDYNTGMIQAEQAGLWLSGNESPTLKSLLDRIATSVAGYWFLEFGKTLKLGIIVIPINPPVNILTGDDVLQSPAPKWQFIDNPVGRVTVKYQHNYTQHSETDLSPDPTLQADRPFLLSDGRTFFNEDPITNAVAKNPQDITVESLCYDVNAANVLSIHVLDIGREGNKYIELSVFGRLFEHSLGDHLQIDIPNIRVNAVVVGTSNDIESGETRLSFLARDQ